MDLTTVVILVVICLGLGVVLDNIARLLLKKEPAPEVVKPAPEEAVPAPTKAALVPFNPAGLEEVVRLWDESDTHALVVEVSGQLIHLAKELSSEQRALLESSLERLSNWLGKPLPVPAPAPVETPESENLAAVVVSDSGSAPAIPPVTPADTSQRVKKPSLNPLDVIVNAFQSDVGKPDFPKSLAEQVDEILQEKLAESTLKGKGIRLLDLPGKGLVVLVGLDKYDGIDAVPDEQVKAILRESVDEWGRRVGGRRV